MQIIRNRTILRRLHRRLGRGRRHGRQSPDRSRRERPDARSRRHVRQARDSKMMAWPYESPRRGAADPPSASSASSTPAGAAGRSTASRTPAPGDRFDWFAHAHARRPHQSLGPHLAALRSRRLPPQEPRRPRRRLADHLRRRQAVLRPLDDLIGIFGSNEGLPNEPDGIFQPPPKPRCYELLVKQASRQAEHHLHPVAPVDPHAAAQRPRRPVTTAASAAAGARRTRTSRRPTVLIRRRSPPGSSPSSPTRWRAR